MADSLLDTDYRIIVTRKLDIRMFLQDKMTQI